MEIERGVQLRTQHRVQALRSERGDDPVVQHTGRVHHTRDPVLRQQPGQRLTVRHIARSDRDRGTELRQFVGEFGHAGRVHAAPRHQQQAPHPVLRHQMPGDQPAQRAGRTGHQHRALGVEHRRRVGPGRPGQPWYAQDVIAQGEFGFARCQRPGQQVARHGVRVEVEVEVEQNEPVGVLGLRRAQQTPDRSVHQILRPRLVGGHRATGHQDQAGGREPVVRQPPLDHGEHIAQSGPHRSGEVGGGRGAQSEKNRVGCGQTAVHRRGQRRQVGEHLGARTQHVLAQRRPAPDRRRRRRRRDGQRDPIHAEQRIREPATGRPHLLLGHLPQHQRVDRGHRSAGLVGQVQGDRVRSGA